MSEILHCLCQLDAVSRSRSSTTDHSSSTDTRQRISPLVFVVRQWARSVGVTGTIGIGFSNFMLTVLVIFFLQTRQLPLLPALGSLKSASSGLCIAVNLRDSITKWFGFNFCRVIGFFGKGNWLKLCAWMGDNGEVLFKAALFFHTRGCGGKSTYQDCIFADNFYEWFLKKGSLQSLHKT